MLNGNHIQSVVCMCVCGFVDGRCKRSGWRQRWAGVQMVIRLPGGLILLSYAGCNCMLCAASVLPLMNGRRGVAVGNMNVFPLGRIHTPHTLLCSAHTHANLRLDFTQKEHRRLQFTWKNHFFGLLASVFLKVSKLSLLAC